MLSDLIIQQIDNVCVMRKINKIISHKKLFIEFLLIYIIYILLKQIGHLC